MAVTIAVGCGPSLRRVQDSRVYFERCYAADFDPRIPLAQKHACWTAWLEHYAGGQPPERASYARERRSAIEQGESVPRLPGLPEVAMGPRAAAPVTAASEELEVTTAEPATADEEALDRPRRRERRYARPLPRTSNPSCAARACEGAWRECLERCPDDRQPCQTACTVELQACSRGCF